MDSDYIGQQQSFFFATDSLIPSDPHRVDCGAVASRASGVWCSVDAFVRAIIELRDEGPLLVGQLGVRRHRVISGRDTDRL